MNEQTFASFAIALLVAGCGGDSMGEVNSKAQEEKSPAAEAVVIDLPENIDTSRNRNVPVSFHFPASEGAQPLVILSHGASGTRDGLYALASEIARQGYVAMCLEHVTSNLDYIRQSMRGERLGFKDALIACGNDMTPRKNRPLDVRFAIDLAEKLNRDDVAMKGRIDMSKIAMLGHSYGAYTAMVCCGVKPVRIEEDLTEPRIKLGIALSPQTASGIFFDEDSFSGVTLPFVGITGTGDNTYDTTSAEGRRDFLDLMPRGDKHFLLFHDAGHFSFSDPTGSNRKVAIRPDRDVTNALKHLVPAILDTYLRGESKLNESRRDELITKSLGGKVRKIDWITK